MKMKKNKILKVVLISLVSLILATLIVWIEVGIHIEWGPFRFLAFDKREKTIVSTYNSQEMQHEIVFYGASNFRLWKEMEEDMAPFKVQNHGFGGSTDNDLMSRADTLLYPYNPSVVVFQTGSNDYAKLSGTEDEIFEQVISTKIKMLETFHSKLPDAYFIVVSGILMPGRSQYDSIVKMVNSYMKDYCAKTDYIYYVDAQDMTVDENGNHITDMFIDDGIHLTHESRIKWANEYIKPILEQVASEHTELNEFIYIH